MTINWKDTKKEMPKESGEYLCYATTGYVTELSYSKKHNVFNARDSQDEKFANSVKIEVSYWADRFKREDIENEIMA